MFGFFKRKDNEFKITITRTGKEAIDAEKIEKEFLTKAHTCPECGSLNKPSLIRTEGDGRKYEIPMKCDKCRCEWTYERPYIF